MFRRRKFWIKHLAASRTIRRPRLALFGGRNTVDAHFIMKFRGGFKPASTLLSKCSTILSCLKPCGIRSPNWARARLPAIPSDQHRTKEEITYRKTWISERKTEAETVSPFSLAASRKRHSILADKPKMKAITDGMSVTASNNQRQVGLEKHTVEACCSY